MSQLLVRCRMCSAHWTEMTSRSSRQIREEDGFRVEEEHRQADGAWQLTGLCAACAFQQVKEDTS